MHSALGDPTTRDTSFSDDWLPGQSTLPAAFVGEILRRSDFEYTDGKLTKDLVWIDADGPDAETNKFITLYGYDFSGQRERTETPAGTITRWTFDALGRLLTTSIGTDDSQTSNMKVSEERFYDEISGGTRTRNNLGYLTTVRRYSENSTAECATGTTFCETQYDYDERGRLTETRAPEDRKTIQLYSNLDAVTVSEIYDSSVVPDVLVWKTENIYDDLGRVYEARTYKVPEDGTYASVEYWRDGRGLQIKERSGGSVFRKTQYDGAARAVKQSVSFDDVEDDSAYAEADDVDDDTVVEESRREYDGLGAVIFAAHYMRYGTATGQGPLTMTNAKAQFGVTWFDEHHRRVLGIDYGDNGGAQMTSRPAGNPPTTSGTDRLVSRTTYTLESEVYQVFDPKGTETRHEYHDYGPLKKRIENFEDGAFSPLALDEDRITEYERYLDYTVGPTTYPMVDIVRRKDRISISGSYKVQETRYAYGVACGTGSTDSRLHSNDLLAEVHHPDPTSGWASTADEDVEKFAYDLQGKLIWHRERSDAPHLEHFFTLDCQGLQTAHQVVVPPGMDNLVEVINFERDILGRPRRVWAEDTDPEPNEVVNDVVIDFGPYGVVDDLKQENDGAVDAFTPVTSFGYQFPVAGEDAVRRTSTSYPDGTTVITDVYDPVANGGIDDRMNRITGRQIGGTWIFRETYVGLDGLSGRDYGAGSMSWDLGLDRFARPSWLYVWNGSEYVNIYSYTHDFNSRITFRETSSEDCVAFAQFSEGYAYDALGRLIERERGWADPGTQTFLQVYESECLTRDPAANVTDYYKGGTSSCGSTTDFTFNATNEITSRTLPGQSPDPYYAGYNDAGDMTNKSTELYTYDGFHRLVAAGTETLEWNGLGWLVEHSAEQKNFYYSPDGELLFEDHPYYSDTWHVWGSQGAGDYVAMGSGTAVTYFHVQDAEGNTVTQLEPDGTVAARFLYDAYGAPQEIGGDWCGTYQISRDLVLYGGLLYIKDRGQYVVAPAIFEPELGVLLQQTDEDDDDTTPGQPATGRTRVGPPPVSNPGTISGPGDRSTCPGKVSNFALIDAICGPEVAPWLGKRMAKSAMDPLIAYLGAKGPIHFGIGLLGGVAGVAAETGGFWLGALYEFAQLVRPGSVWDFKRSVQFSATGPKDAVCPTPPCERTVTLCGVCVNYDVPGNIHYGYICRAAGFRESVCRNAPSFVQEGGPPDPGHDTCAINLGMELWGLTAGGPSQATLCSLFEKYEHCLNKDRTQGCRPCRNEFSGGNLVR